MRSHDEENPIDAITDTGIAHTANPREDAAVVMITPRKGFIPFPGSSSLLFMVGSPRITSGISAVEIIIEIKSLRPIPDPLRPDSTASLISLGAIVPGLQDEINPAGSMTITASVGPLGNAKPVLEPGSSMSKGQDSLIESACPSRFTADWSTAVEI